MATLLIDSEAMQLEGARAEGGSLWLPVSKLAATGWELKPEGLCRDEVCVPRPGLEAAGIIKGTEVDFAGFLRHMGQPVAHDTETATWATGPAAEDRTESLRSLEAPDFELPDLAGKRHRLSDYRGRRIFLVSWASW